MVTRTDIGNIGFWEGGLDTQERMDGEWDTCRECQEVQRLLLHSSTSILFHQLLVLCC